MTTYNTGNPLGSTDPRDLYDNAENLDEAVNSDEDTFQDRMGKSRLTWTGVMKAGSGDPAIAVDAAARAIEAADRAEDAESSVEQNAAQIAADAAQQAVTDVVIAVDGAVDRSENAADRAETEADRAEIAQEAATTTSRIYPTITAGFNDTTEGDYFWVVSSDDSRILDLRYREASSTTYVRSMASRALMESYSLAGGRPSNTSVSVDTTTKTISISGRFFIGARSELLNGTLDYSTLEGSGNLYILYDVSAGEFVGLSAAEANSLNWRSSQYIFICSYRPSTQRVEGLSGSYTIDGIELSQGNRGHAQIYCPSGTINVDTSAKTITFPSRAVISSGIATVTLPAETVYDYSEESSFTFFIVYNSVTESFRKVAGSSIPLLKPAEFVIGLFNRTSGTFLEGVTTYTIDGSPSTSLNESAKTNYSLILTRPSSLNFDFNNNKIVISENLWLAYDGGRLLIAPTEIPLDPARNKGYRTLLLVDPSTSQIVLRSSAAPYSAPKDHVLIGAYQEKDMLFFGLDHFSVNGEIFNPTVEKIKPVFGWSVNNKVDVNVADTFLPSDATNLSNLTSSTVYGWFDDLVAEHPDYITKTLLGNDASGTLPIYQYRFNPKRSGTDGRLDTKIPKVMLITLHNEGINFVYSYLLMREICNNWQNNEALESMRFGMEFVVIPVGNPWGLDNRNRKNSNLVDINRNFPIGWMKLGTPSDTFYSGESALSEAETQHIYSAIVVENPDIFFDCHSYGSWNNNGRSVWIPVLNEKSRITAMSTAEKVYAQYKKKYDWLVDLDELVYISDSTVTGGGLASKSAESVGAVGGTLEIAWSLKDEPTGEAGHNSIVNFATDYLGTTILQALSVIISSK